MSEWKRRSPEEELQRGGEAARLLDTQLWKEMRESIEKTLAAQRRAVPLNQTEMHTRLIITEQLWGQIMDWFQQVADTGRMAEIQIQQQRSLMQRMGFGR